MIYRPPWQKIARTPMFLDVGVQECCFLIGNFSRKFDRRVMIVCLFNEMFYSVSVCSRSY